MERDYTIWRNESRRSQGIKVDGPKGQNWTAQKDKTGRPRGMKLDGQKEWNWTVQIDEISIKVTYKLGSGLLQTKVRVTSN